MEYKLSKLKNLRNDNSVWVGMDDKELFVKNCKEYPNSKSLKYYKENPIEYSFNNYGFRTPDDFNEEDEGNVFLGCSHTMGVGHHLKNTWAYKVNKEVGGKFWNLSQGGCGIQTDYRLLLGWKDTLKIKNIFHYTVPWPRYEFFNDKEMIYLTPRNKSIIKSYKWKFYVDVLSGEKYSNYNQMVYINAIKGLSHEIGCNYYYLTDKILDEFPENDNSLRARDLTHPTVGQQNFLYEQFLKVWENING
jgi:hypothetical protein|tara:strand:+ start:364 stop:1104 length:741 start_codon:yes stop_codon:yes gene_type:complete